MKNVVIAVLFLTVFQGAAQNEVETTVIKGDQLIEYAADHFPADEEQRIYLLVETGSAGIAAESTFYLKKGVELLLKRLGEDDQIAIGVYGAANGTLLPYTSMQSKEAILKEVENLFKGTFGTVQTDGIDLAYNLAKKNDEESATNTVVMIRGTSKKTALASGKNAYKALESVGQHNIQQTSGNQNAGKPESQTKIGGAIALTALTILPELIEIIKN